MAPTLIESAPQDLTPWLIAVAIGAALLLLYTLVRPSSRRAASPASEEDSRDPNVQREMADLMQELSEMAKGVGAQLDARAVKLERLIQQADDRIEQLRSSARGPSNDSAEARVAELTDVPPRSEFDPRHAEIYHLADQGLGLQEIAQRLGRPSGEVELILALRQQA